MLFRTLLFCSIVTGANGQSDFPAVAREKQCPMERVDRYEYTCEERGWIQDPSMLKNYRGVESETSCAELCLANTSCKAFRHIEATGRCLLFSKRLEDMYTVYNNRQTGLLYDRNCFSTNCNVITACKIRAACDYVDDYNGFYYLGLNRFACTYGYTSQAYGESFKEHLLDGSLRTCQAIRNCARKYPRGFDKAVGSFDLHYHLPSNQWVCRIYKQMKSPYYDQIYGALDDKQHVSPTTFSVKNSTVGAAFGYWIDSVYRDD